MLVFASETVRDATITSPVNGLVALIGTVDFGILTIYSSDVGAWIYGGTMSAGIPGPTWMEWTAGEYTTNDLVTHDGTGTLTFYRASATTSKEPGVTVDWANDWDDLGTSLNSTSMGEYAGTDSVGEGCTYLGKYAGYQNSGDDVAAVGDSAAYQNSGSIVTVSGNSAGRENSGDRVVAGGSNAGRGNEGSFCVFFGSTAGYHNTGDYVIGIGQEAARDNTENHVIIVKQDNINTTPLIKGKFHTTTQMVGINTDSPAATCHVNGDFIQEEMGADPSDPADGQSVMWVSDGTGTGSAGDLMRKVTVGATTYIGTVQAVSAMT